MATVEKRGKGYRITVAAGIDLNGKQIRHRLNWTPDEKLTSRQVEKELNRQIARFEEQVKTGSIAAEGNIRFADFAERYMADYGRPNLKPTTLSNYQRNLVRINQAIGHIRLKDLTTFHIQAFYRNLQESGIRSREVATCNEVGRPMFPTSLTQWMGKFIKRSGLPPACVHSLRHTYASLLIAEGTPLVVVSSNLGHAQVSTTSDIYSHVIASAEAKAAQVTDKFAEDIHPKFTPKEKKESVS